MKKKWYMPEQLQDVIRQLIENSNTKGLTGAAEKLYDAYGNRAHNKTINLTPQEKQAYLASRMPSTYAVAAKTVRELLQINKDLRISTVLDIGAGPGTFGLAAMDLLDAVERISFFERDNGWIEIGKSIQQSSSYCTFNLEWTKGDIIDVSSLHNADLVLTGYALNELSADKISAVVNKIWQAATKALIVVEPGSPQGFNVIKRARDLLIASGARIIAPCTHNFSCPMPDSNWCHFSHKVIRNDLHRATKQGTANYEMEKYSYIIAVKDAVGVSEGARIIAAPMLRKGHVILDVCDDDGKLKRRTISRRDKEAYVAAKRYSWGDRVRSNATNQT